ncbi:MAG: NAD(P)H-quinone oxidoreductase, partial [Gammaproteobacteria bacterium]|nr:NAD(P)H-quinone oxidoreductase [Gammaproteobacteria bacterium]
MNSNMFFINHGIGGRPEVMKLDSTSIPKPRLDEVLIQVKYAGVNRPDCLQRMGKYHPPSDASPILGLEVSGQIVSLGEKVTKWSVGDQVCALTNGGGYAEYVCAPETQVLPIPDNLNLEQACALPENFFTVWTNVFQRGKLKRGESILIHGGSSGIGLTAIQLAHHYQAEVYCTVGTDEKASICYKNGANHCINYKTQDFVHEVMHHTHNRGLDMILD